MNILNLLNRAIACDASEAARFLSLLDPAATSFFLQTYAEKRSGSVVVPGAKEIELSELNGFLTSAENAAIAVTVNESFGGRKGADIRRIRAVWQEDDGDGLTVFPLQPSLTVQTSPGHFHRYWLVEGDWPADEAGRDDFKAVMAGLVETYGGDRSASDITRVLRLPGTLHRKTDTPHLVQLIEPSVGEEPVRHTRQQLIEAFAIGPDQSSRSKVAELIYNHAAVGAACILHCDFQPDFYQ